MGRIKIAGVCAALALTVSAGAATAASAEVPELGRCVRVEPTQEGKKMVYRGGYGGATCLKKNPNGRGRYTFLPGPGPNNKFYGSTSEPEPVLETVGGAKIDCVSASFKGEYTGPKTESVTVILSGCETPAGQICETSPAKPEEIEGTAALEGELGTISKASKKPSVGWDLKHSGALFTYTCGTLPAVPSVQELEGSVIGEVAAGAFSNLDRMNTESLIKYKQVKGIQIPEMFEGAAKDTLLTNFVTEKKTEQTGLSAIDEQVSGLGEPIENHENQEPLEIKAIEK